MVLAELQGAAISTLLDVAPIVLVLLFFQGVVLRRRPARLNRILLGALYVVLGLILFRLGLTLSILPIGTSLAEALVEGGAVDDSSWHGFFLLYAFAGAVGFAAALAEPALIAVAERVRELTGGALRPLHLRLLVALGIALGLVLGIVRIVLGVPYGPSLLALVVPVAGLAVAAPRAVRGLAFDVGPITLSAVTVPLFAAIGVGTAAAIPGRDPLTDGFGLILFPLMLAVASVLAFAVWQARGGGNAGGDDAVQAAPGARP